MVADPLANGRSRDPLLVDEEHGEKLMAVRKDLAFKGFTFRRPKASGHDRMHVPIQAMFNGSGFASAPGDTHSRAMSCS